MWSPCWAEGVIHVESLLKTAPDIIFLKPETRLFQKKLENWIGLIFPIFQPGIPIWVLRGP